MWRMVCTCLYILVILYCSTEAHDSISSIVEQVRAVDAKIGELKIDLPRVAEYVRTKIPHMEAFMKTELSVMESKLSNNIIMSQLSLEDKILHDIVPDYIERQVEQAITRKLRHESLEGIVSAHVLKEVRQVKRVVRDIKRQIRHLGLQVEPGREQNVEKIESQITWDQDRLEAELNETRQRVEAVERDQENACDWVKRELSQTQLNVTLLQEGAVSLSENLQTQIRSLDEKLQTGFNRTHNKMDMLEKTTTSIEEDVKVLNETTLALQHGVKKFDCNTSNITTDVTMVTTPPLPVTHKPLYRMTRILAAPYWLSSSKKFKQHSLHNKSLGSYPLSVSFVLAIAYDPATNRVLVSRYKPAGIFSYGLDRTDSRTLKLGVMSEGIAIDRGRQLVMFSTWHPNYTISQMSSNGSDFRGIVDLDHYSRGIALDEKRQLIYGAQFNSIIVLTYAGDVLHTLPTAGYTYSVALDYMGDNVFYANNTQIVGHTVPRNETSLVTELAYNIWSILYYDNVIYTSGRYNSIIDALSMDSRLHSKLQSGFLNTELTLMCLLP